MDIGVLALARDKNFIGVSCYYAWAYGILRYLCRWSIFTAKHSIVGLQDVFVNL